METQENINYHRIEQAIHYLVKNHMIQPTLNELAEHVNLSPSHFQRMFVEWAGTTPKKFLKYISIQHAKQLLAREETETLFNTTHELGLSSTSRLHDMFVTIEGMSPAEYKNGGKNLVISYAFYDSPFGPIIVASTDKGICHLAFYTNGEIAEHELRLRFPLATYHQEEDEFQHNAIDIFKRHGHSLPQIKLHLQGTEFQLKVWEALLKIPQGALETYARIADSIGSPKAYRAVGTAIGSNPIAFLIPCHRVIQGSGALGGYRWGNARKIALIGWEQCQLDTQSQTPD